MGAGPGEGRRRPGEPQAWYFNGNYPWLGMAILRPGHRPVVLVHRPVHRAARPRRPERDGRPPGQHLRRLPQALPGLPLHHPRPDLLRPRQERQGPRPRAPDRTRRQGDPSAAQGAFPLMVQYLLPAGPARHRGGRPALRAHGLARRRVQRLLDALHRGHLREVEAQGHPAAARPHRPHRDRRHGGDRPRLDPGGQGRARPLQLPAGRPGLPRPADLRGVLLRRLLEAAELPRAASGR